MKKLGFGCMRMPLLDVEDQTSVDFEQVCQMVDTFLERGFTYFDTAYMYHKYASERVVKEALVKRHARDSYTLATKLPTMFLKEEGQQEQIFEEQMEKCGVDYFDYYLLHNLNQANYETARKFDSFAFVQKKKEEGRVRQFGFSFHDTAEVLDQILTEHPEVDFVQLQINYLDWENERIQSGKCYETAVKHGKKVIVMEPVKGGKLAKLPEEAEKLLLGAHPDWTVPSWGIRFAASLPEVMVVLSGMSNMEQMLDNTGYMQEFELLTEADQQIVKEAAEIIRNAIAIPCTECRYCVEGCPAQIEIPALFNLYNAENQALNRGYSTQKENYAKQTESGGKASECVECGQCEDACPQHIQIRDWMKEITQMFEA